MFNSIQSWFLFNPIRRDKKLTEPYSVSRPRSNWGIIAWKTGAPIKSDTVYHSYYIAFKIFKQAIKFSIRKYLNYTIHFYIYFLIRRIVSYGCFNSQWSGEPLIHPVFLDNLYCSKYKNYIVIFESSIFIIKYIHVFHHNMHFTTDSKIRCFSKVI